LPRHGENEDIEQAFIAKLSDSESEAAETQVWFDFAARCNYMKLSVASDLEMAYDQIIGQIIKMIEEANKWIIRVK
jgi:four helix bundle protein